MPEPAAGEVRVRVRYAGHLRLRPAHLSRQEPVRRLPARHRPRVRRPHRSGRRRRRRARASARRSWSIRSSAAAAAMRASIGRQQRVPQPAGDRRASRRRLQRVRMRARRRTPTWCRRALPDASASIIEPFAVAANVTSRTGVFPSDVALIYGAGPVGPQPAAGAEGRLRHPRLHHRPASTSAWRWRCKCGAADDEIINTAREPLARSAGQARRRRRPDR